MDSPFILGPFTIIVCIKEGISLDLRFAKVRFSIGG